MTTNSGEEKLLRVIRQLENAEILLGGLPKRFTQPAKRKERMKQIIAEISNLQEELKELYKFELENPEGE